MPAQVVARLFSSHAPQAAPQRPGKSSSVTRLHKAHTVAAKFQQSLLDLIEKMERWVRRPGPPPAAPGEALSSGASPASRPGQV